MRLAYIKGEPGFEPGLTYQVSPDLYRYPSLVWDDPFGRLFFPSLHRANDRFDMCGTCDIASRSWIDIARYAEEVEDRLRGGHATSADMLAAAPELGPFLQSGDARVRLIGALQLSSFWIRQAAATHPALTFYGV